jgi:hypothetical protein
VIRLTGNQLARVNAALLDAYDSRDDFELLVYSVGQRSLDQIAKTQNLERDIRRVVMVALRDHWIVELLTQAAGERPEVAAIAQLAAELAPAATPATADPWKACRPNGLPFVDRAPVREAVRDLDGDLGSRILAVGGPSTSGKSHVSNLVAWRAGQNRDGLVFIELPKLVDHSAAADDPVPPRTLAEAICEQMGLDKDALLPGPGEQDSRWSYAFCNRLQAHVLKQRTLEGPVKRWWIVIDEFNSLPLSQQTADLLKELATRVGRVITEFRLVLLGYDAVLSPDVGAVQRAQIQVLTGQELEEYFIDLFQELGRPVDAKRVADAIAAVLQEFNPKDPLRMRALGKSVAAETQAIVAG